MVFKTAFFALTLLSLCVFASEDEFALHESKAPTPIYDRTLKVLNHFQVPEDINSQNFLQDLSGQQSSVNINILLPYFGSINETNGFFKLSDSKFQGFKDFKAQQVLDFSINLKSTDTTVNQNTFHERLIEAQKNFATKKAPFVVRKRGFFMELAFQFGG